MKIRKPAKRMYFALVTLLPSCGNEAGQQDPRVFSEAIEVLPTSSLRSLELILRQRVVLGAGDSAGFINEIRDFAQGPAGDWLVLDAHAKAVVVFDTLGRLVKKIGRSGRGPGEFLDPFRIAVANRLLYVADLGSGTSIAKFTAAGKFLSLLSLPVGGTPTDLALNDDHLAVMTSALSDPERLGWEIVEVFDTSGRSTMRFCQLDPRYPESSRTEGMIHRVAYGSVGIQGSVVYCSQSISPTIQLMNIDNGRRWLLNKAPPIYTAPEEQHTSTNRVNVFEFLSKWTAQTRTLLIPGGVLQMYSRYNKEQSDFVRWLFACRTKSNWRNVTTCGIAELNGVLLDANSFDEIIVAEPLEVADESAAISIYSAKLP